MSDETSAQYTIFDPTTGKAVSYSKRLPAETAGIAGIVVAGRWDAALYWMDEGIVVPRPAALATTDYAITADGVDAISITVPPDTMVQSYLEDLHKGKIVTMRREHACPDGVFEFVTGKVGTFVFDVEPPYPWRAQTITVTASAP